MTHHAELDFWGGCRLVIVANQLPVRVKRIDDGWDYEWDEDALVAQAKVRSDDASSSYARARRAGQRAVSYTAHAPAGADQPMLHLCTP
jgi:hypothetical protein